MLIHHAHVAYLRSVVLQYWLCDLLHLGHPRVVWLVVHAGKCCQDVAELLQAHGAQLVVALHLEPMHPLLRIGDDTC